MWDALAFLGAFIAIEGAIYAAAPDAARRLARTVTETGDRELRIAGFAALVLGVFVVWLLRG